MCVFIFQLVGVELKTNQIMLHVALPDADTQGLPFFVPCTPPTSFFVWFFFFPGTQEIWLPDFQQMLLSLSTGLAIFSHHPVLSFSAFALTRRSVVGVRCLHKRDKGWKKGHGSESLGCHLLETHFLGHPKQNGG